jgi:hypothetical protein
MVMFVFAFEPRFKPLLACAGITPARARVEVTDTQVIATFGSWTCATPRSNVKEICATGPYRWFKAIGVRGSLADRGLTFGSTTAGGVCLLFHEPVRGIEPTGRFRHPGLTVTVADVDGLVRALSD